MNSLHGLIIIGALAATGAHAGPAAQECSEAVSKGQHLSGMAAASAEDRVGEYLEFHARATEATGRLPLSAWPASHARSN